MKQTLIVNRFELKECVARAVGRILNEEISEGEPLNEGLIDKIKVAAKKYGIPAALGILTVLGAKYGMSEEEIDQIEADMKVHPEKYFGPTEENGGIDDGDDIYHLPEVSYSDLP